MRESFHCFRVAPFCNTPVMHSGVHTADIFKHNPLTKEEKRTNCLNKNKQHLATGQIQKCVHIIETYIFLHLLSFLIQMPRKAAVCTGFVQCTDEKDSRQRIKSTFTHIQNSHPHIVTCILVPGLIWGKLLEVFMLLSPGIFYNKI